MDLEEAKIYAAEQVLNALVSGERFKGLGPLARGLVRDISQPANENALLISKESDRTTERWQEMEKLVVEQFVKNVLGFSEIRDKVSYTNRPYTLREASDELVEAVWNIYIRWAQARSKIAAAMPPR